MTFIYPFFHPFPSSLIPISSLYIHPLSLTLFQPPPYLIPFLFHLALSLSLSLSLSLLVSPLLVIPPFMSPIPLPISIFLLHFLLCFLPPFLPPSSISPSSIYTFSPNPYIPSPPLPPFLSHSSCFSFPCLPPGPVSLPQKDPAHLGTVSLSLRRFHPRPDKHSLAKDDVAY